MASTPLRMDDVLLLEGEEKLSWQACLRSIVRGQIPGAVISISREEAEVSLDKTNPGWRCPPENGYTVEELTGRMNTLVDAERARMAHAIYNAVKYQLSAATSYYTAHTGRSAHWTDFIALSRSKPNVVVWRRTDEARKGQLVDLPNEFRNYFDQVGAFRHKHDVNYEQDHPNARMAEPGGGARSAPTHPRVAARALTRAAS